MTTKLRVAFLAITVLTLLNFAPGASASVSGAFNLANCGGGGVTVYGPNGNGANANLIDWFTPMFGGVGCDITGGGTNLTYFNGVSTVALGVNTSGTINDLTPGTGAANFFSFASAPALVFNLLVVGPGVANTTCAGLAIGSSCSPVAGSPFIFTETATGVGVELDASGSVHDAGPGSVPWLGAFTTQLPGTTAGALQTTILANGGTITSTWSGSFITGPEPYSAFMIGGGLLILAVLLRRRNRTA